MGAHAKYVAMVAGLVGTVVVTAAASLAPRPFAPDSQLWLEGTSTVRSFTCKATDLKGSVDPAQGTLAVADLQKTVRSAEMSVKVEDLECGNGTMNSHLFKALKGTEHPTIEYRLTEHTVSAKGAAEGTAKLTGQLKIAGKERPIVIDGVTVREANGTLRVQGSKEIVMSDYGVKPPTLMMGTMKVGEKVTVHFDVVLK